MNVRSSTSRGAVGMEYGILIIAVFARKFIQSSIEIPIHLYTLFSLFVLNGLVQSQLHIK